MIDQELLSKFWKEFHLPTQDEDDTYPIANPNDAVKTLIKCRNWLGIFTENLIKTEYELMGFRKKLHTCQKNYSTLRNKYLTELRKTNSLSLLKTKDIQEALISERSEGDIIFNTLKQELHDLEHNIIEGDTDKALLEFLLKRIEKSVDWLSQYLNWCKFELRANV